MKLAFHALDQLYLLPRCGSKLCHPNKGLAQPFALRQPFTQLLEAHLVGRPQGTSTLY